MIVFFFFFRNTVERKTEDSGRRDNIIFFCRDSVKYLRVDIFEISKIRLPARED